MRLQSAIFYLEDTLLLDGEAGKSAEKVLSILKMESVWMAAVTAMPRETAEAALKARKLLDCFRLILPQEEALCSVESGELLEKAMRRLKSQKRDTVVFCATEKQIETANGAGFRTVAVKCAANADEWETIKNLATEAIEGYEELLEN